MGPGPLGGGGRAPGAPPLDPLVTQYSTVGESLNLT